MLPTFAVVLAAYAVYAFWSAWPRRQGGLSRTRRRRRQAWLALGSSVGAGLLLFLWLHLPPAPADHELRLAGLLGLGGADGWAAAKADPRAESLPVKGQKAGDQPVYTFLHPEAPPSEMAPGKKPPPPKPLKKPRLREVPKSQAKGTKATTPSSKKDRVAGKSRPKKKKQSSTPGGQKATAG